MSPTRIRHGLFALAAAALLLPLPTKADNAQKQVKKELSGSITYIAPSQKTELKKEPASTGRPAGVKAKSK